MGRELRFSFEMRAAGGTGDADPLRLEGYAAKYNTWSQDLGGFIETIKPGAFDRALKENQDIRALMNHDPNIVLGRTKAKTLSLRSDDIGLWYSAILPNTQVARDLHTSVTRGDIDQCSFAFNVVDGGEKWSDERSADGKGRVTKRELTDVNIFDVSAVTYPAYLDTKVAARSRWSDVVPQEVRSGVEAREAEDSYEELTRDLSTALSKAFPLDGPGDSAAPSYYGGKYWIIESYSDHVIVCTAGTDEYFNIPYTGEDDDITFGDPVAVEKQWVPTSDRAKKSVALYRGSKYAPAVTESKPVVETREVSGDPGASGKMEGVSVKPSKKLVLADASAKKAAAHAAVKAAKVAYMKAKSDAAGAGDDATAKAAAGAAMAAAHASFKSAKVDHMKAAEEESALKASYNSDDDPDCSDDDNGDGMYEPGECNCRHCRTGLIDSTDDEEGMEDCSDPTCRCQNRWSVTGDEGGSGPRSDPKAAEVRWDAPDFYEQRDDKARTKRVGGKDLTAGNFAYVGDPDRTETWKLPIHDAAHVRNALARFNQTKGIPANKKAGVHRKIVAAAKKFGIEVSTEKNSLMLAACPPDEEEVAEIRKRAEELRIKIETA